MFGAGWEMKCMFSKSCPSAEETSRSYILKEPPLGEKERVQDFYQISG